MSVEKLCTSLEKCSNKFVSVEIIGAISIPHFIQKFEFSESEDYIFFGEEDSENYPFEICKESICDIKFLNDVFEYNDYVYLEFSIVNNELSLVTTLRILCEDGGFENE